MWILESHTFASGGALRDSVYYFQGISATVSGSSSDTSWMVADPGPHGSRFNSIVAEKVVINGGSSQWRFRGENYHGDAILLTDINGEQLEHIHYTCPSSPARVDSAMWCWTR